MLFRAGRETFTTGVASDVDESPASPQAIDKIWIQLRPGRGAGPSFLAELDTGAVWSMLPRELLPDAEPTGEEAGPILTALGPISGPLVRARLAFVPSAGSELVIDATILATTDWPGPPIVGYRGFLERICLAIDPGRNEIHFGAISP